MRIRVLPLLLLALLWAPAPASAGERYDASIKRTAHGIPHIEARDWGGLGYGYGYAFAQDNLCVMADQYVTVRGERSRYFGPDGTWQLRGNGTTNRNLESDFFFKRIIDRGQIEKLLGQDPPLGPRPEVREVVRGYVAGYNRYLRDTGVDNLPDPACRGAAWVREIDEIDAYRRFYQLALLASGAVAIEGIGGAQPPPPGDVGGLPGGLPQLPDVREAPGVDEVTDVAERLLEELPIQDIGSNAYGLGREQTDNGKGMLLGNPHFPWDGTERLYQAHLTIPGTLDVQGGSLYGVPIVLIGNTHGLAWSHTVSTAFRFTPFELTLVPGSPTTYLVDGQPKEMERDELVVDVRRDDGSIGQERRTLYTTEHGPMFDELLGQPLFPWAQGKGFAMGDANAENFRYLNHFFETNLAQSVREYDRVLRRNQGIPWVNSIAADRRGEAYYADISVVPHVTDEKARVCNTALGAGTFAALGLPVLDGSRSACDWGTDPSAVQPGTFGPEEHLPSMRRTDYVMNANDSYWLGNLDQRLEGFPRIIGDERTERSLRTRLGLLMVHDRTFTRRSLMDTVFNNRQYAGELWRDELLLACDTTPGYEEACAALRLWNVRDDLDSRGALLFRRIAQRLLASPNATAPVPPWEVPFTPEDPVNTPRGLNENDPRVRQAIKDATDELRRLEIPLDARLGDVQADVRGGERIPIHGGPGTAGVFNAINVSASDLRPRTGYGTVPHGSSYVQVVHFTDGRECDVEPRTIVTYSQSTNETSPFAADQTRMYSRKRWVDVPFCRRDVERATRSEVRVSSSAPTSAPAPSTGAAGSAGSIAAAARCPERLPVRAQPRGGLMRFGGPAGTRVEIFRLTARGYVRAGRGTAFRPRAGTYMARFKRGTQSRRIAFTSSGGRAKVLPAFERVTPCGPVRRLKLTAPAFGARRALGVSFRLGEPAQVELRVLRGRKLVRRIAGRRGPKAEHRLRLPASSARGTYRVVLVATGPSGTVRQTVSAVRR